MEPPDNLLRYLALANVYPDRDIIRGVEWTAIRRRYAELLAAAKAAGTTQESVAERGGLSGQNAISKLLRNNNLGPSVETFVRAVEGLGISVGTFFADLERAQEPVVVPPVEKALMDRVRDLEMAVKAITPASSISLTDSSHGSGVPPPDSRRTQDGGTHSLSGTGVVNNINTHTADVDKFEIIVKKHVDELAGQLGRLADHLERHRASDEHANPRTADGGSHLR